jgi:hypothetical protein
VNNTDTTNTETEGVRFNRWLARVNAAMTSDYGFGIDDIEDDDYYAYWEMGYSVSDAAHAAVVNAGYNDSFL